MGFFSNLFKSPSPGKSEYLSILNEIYDFTADGGRQLMEYGRYQSPLMLVFFTMLRSVKMNILMISGESSLVDIAGNLFCECCVFFDCSWQKDLYEKWGYPVGQSEISKDLFDDVNSHRLNILIHALEVSRGDRSRILNNLFYKVIDPDYSDRLSYGEKEYILCDDGDSALNFEDRINKICDYCNIRIGRPTPFSSIVLSYDKLSESLLNDFDYDNYVVENHWPEDWRED